MTRRVVRFTVAVVVEDHGEFDEQYVADAIYHGLKIANVALAQLADGLVRTLSLGCRSR